MMAALGPHGAFIAFSYAAAILVTALLIAWVLLDHRIQARRLGELEARGVRRRSAARAEAATPIEAKEAPR